MPKNRHPQLNASFLAARERHRRGDLAGAEAIYGRLLALDPADDEVLFLFGCLKASQGDVAVGLDCLRVAQQLNPAQPQIPYTTGVLQQEAGRLAEAAAAYRQALTIDPSQLMAWENLCAACYDLGDPTAGLAAAMQALALDRKSPLAIRGAANCLAALGRRAEALAVLEDGLKFHPAHPDLRIHRSWELMANGRFGEGWRELEWRHARRGRADPPPRSVPFSRWNGEPPAGKTILVYGEQGVGDEVMFAPYVLGLVGAGAQCWLECEPRLERLFARAFPACRILQRDDRRQIAWHAGLQGVDYCISALSLPSYFPHPLDRRPFLSADPVRAASWRQRLQAAGPGLKVGVSWRGGADAKARGIRSVPPQVFGGLVGAGTAFVSLQYGATAEEAAAVSPDLAVFPEVDPLRDLDEFCALLSALDAVVSVDNSTVHLAGALGVPTLMLLPVYSEWRWGNLPSGTSPWYRSVDFIRQPEASDDGWRSTVAVARQWLASRRQEAAAVPGRAAPESKAVAEIRSAPAKAERKALLVGDTHYWYHWGCACTSLGLHEGLRTRFDRIRVLPLPRLLSGCPTPTGVASLDCDVFFRQFRQDCPDIVEAIEAADCVVVNGEGSIHGVRPLPLFLLYVAYVAGRRFGKRTAVVNHSCYPGAAVLADGVSSASDYYARVYAALDLAVVRERQSLANVAAFGGKVVLGFDCLPLFLAGHRPEQEGVRQRKLVLGGSVSWSPEMVDCFADLAEWAVGEGFSLEILSGAKALLAADEVGFVAQMVRTLDARKVAHTLHFPVSEREWLEAIGTASLVVSGRFHYSIAAAFQRVPFLVAESNTAKITGLLAELGLEADAVALERRDYAAVVGKARRLLDGKAGVVSAERLEMLRERARLNFSSLQLPQ